MTVAKSKTILIAYGSDSLFPLAVKNALRNSSVTLSFATDIESTISLALEEKPDLIILDLLLPRCGAYAVVQSLRRMDILVPILLACPTGESSILYSTERDYFVGTLDTSSSAVDILNRIRHSLLFETAKYSLNEMAQIMEVSNDAMTLTDASGTIRYVNLSFSNLTGFSVEDVVGENPRLWRTGTQKPSFYENLWRTIQGGSLWMGLVRNRRRDNSHYGCTLSISPLINFGTKPSGYLGVHRVKSTTSAT